MNVFKGIKYDQISRIFLAWTKCLMCIWAGPNRLQVKETNDNAEKKKLENNFRIKFLEEVDF